MTFLDLSSYALLLSSHAPSCYVCSITSRSIQTVQLGGVHLTATSVGSITISENTSCAIHVSTANVALKSH